MLEWIWEILKTTATKMGDGTGFPIIFGTYMTMLISESIISLVRGRKNFTKKDSLGNIYAALVKVIVETLLTGGVVMIAYIFLYEKFRFFTIPFEWWGWVLAFLLNDLGYYTDHRISHRTGLFWAMHIPHHSSKEMNLLVSNRGTALDLAGLTYPTNYILPLLGLHPAMFLAVKFFGNLWGIFNHTRLIKRMGFLEEILATPANHRVHHGIETKYLDKNYTQTFMIWDRLFGTFQKEEEEPTYGLTSQVDVFSVWDIHTLGFQWLFGRIKSAKRWQDKLAYLYQPPGWDHNGNHERTEDLVKKEQEKLKFNSNSNQSEPFQERAAS